MHAVHRWISPPVAFAIAALAMWWLRRSTDWGSFSFAGQAPLGIALIAVGLLIVAVSVRSFARARTTPNPMQPGNASELVTSGLYRLSRNPMYVGDALMLVGVAVWLGSVPALLVAAAFVAFIDRFQIAAEERALQQVFGARYDAYRMRVRRWL